MRKLLFFIVMFLGVVPSTVSAQNMRDIFLNAPDAIFPLLDKSYRADLVDYIDAGMKAKVTNKFDGISVLEQLDDDYMRLATSESSMMQMKLLPTQGDTIICVVKSVRAEAVDSRICFYDKEWNLLAVGEKFRAPSISEFFISPEDAAEHIDICDIYLVALELSANENSLVAEYTMPVYMSREDAERVAPCLRKLVYMWNGEMFCEAKK